MQCRCFAPTIGCYLLHHRRRLDFQVQPIHSYPQHCYCLLSLIEAPLPIRRHHSLPTLEWFAGETYHCRRAVTKVLRLHNNNNNNKKTQIKQQYGNQSILTNTNVPSLCNHSTTVSGKVKNSVRKHSDWKIGYQFLV